MKRIIYILFKVLIYLDNRFLIRLPDSLYLKILFRVRMNRKLNLKNPTTFNQKLQWLKLNDRKDIYTIMVDKYEVKEYVASVIGEQYIIPTIGIYESFNDINFNELPDQFVIKCTHDSGGVVICKDKSKMDLLEIKSKIEFCLKQDFYRVGREWPYKNVKPRIIIEKYMNDEIHEDLLDYKLMCFNGKVKCSFICSDRRSELGLAVDFYDANWKLMPFTRHYRNSGNLHIKPENYDLMVKLSEKLSKNIPFVRVDFYEIKGKIYFGELTFYPGCGLEEFEPEEYDEILGSWITLKDGEVK